MRLIYFLGYRNHVTHAFVSLHWLGVAERMQYKVAVLAYKVLHDITPQYIGPSV